MTVTRKQVAQALLDLMAPANGPFPTKGRRLVDPENIGHGQYPALFLIKPTEKYDRQSGNSSKSLGAKRSIDFFAVIYTDIGNDANAIPADVQDDLIDFLDQALKPSVIDNIKNQGMNSLGGMVSSVVIDGEIDLAPGDKQGKGTIVVPICVSLLPVS